MRRHFIVALAVPAVAAVFVWGGCALAIDLGDEAKLRPEEASVDAQTGSVDAGAEDVTTPVVYACGLPPLVNPACGECFEARCCPTGKACANDPACIAGLECIQDCVAQVDCIVGCLSGNNQALSDMVTCSSNQCPVCTPGPECQKLGDCVHPLRDAGEEGLRLLYRVARGTILELDPVKCEKQRTQVGEKSDAAACH